MRLVAAACWVVLGAGCAPPPERVDTALPLKERVAILTGQLEQKHQELAAAERETKRLSAQLDRLRRLAPAVKELEFTVQRIDVGWLSGGRNWDGTPGDDGIRLYVFPIDQHGHTVKRAGRVDIRLTDEAMPEGERQIGAWKFETAETVRKWTSSPVAYGYQFDLRWQTGPPLHADLTVRVDFAGLGGGRFSATRKLSPVKLPSLPTTAPDTQPRSR